VARDDDDEDEEDEDRGGAKRPAVILFVACAAFGVAWFYGTWPFPSATAPTEAASFDEHIERIRPAPRPPSAQPMDLALEKAAPPNPGT
jgi:hypothetical protein